MKNSSQKVRFIAVGGINTLIDFGLLFTLKAIGLPAISANVVSTTSAFCFSFFANKKYAFQTAGTNIRREIFLFIVVTLFGLWVLQTLVIAFITSLLSQTHLQEGVVLLVAKLFATAVSLIWNYVLYSRVVFKQP